MPDVLLPKPLESILERIDSTPDSPITFGYKMAWLAIKATDAENVLSSLDIRNVQASNWQTGVVAAYNGHAFVSPSVKGWVFVLSQMLPEPSGNSEDEWSELLCRLSNQFDDVQYFGTHRVVEFHAWARFMNGNEIRAYAYLGERGETLVDRGEKTTGELDLGYNYFVPESQEAESDSYWEREDLCYPDEDHVMEVAGKWSIDPNTLEDVGLPHGVGWIGNLVRSSNQATR